MGAVQHSSWDRMWRQVGPDRLWVFYVDQILTVWVCLPFVNSVHLKFYLCALSVGPGIRIQAADLWRLLGTT